MIQLQSNSANIRKRLLAVAVPLILQRENKTRQTKKKAKKGKKKKKLE